MPYSKVDERYVNEYIKRSIALTRAIEGQAAEVASGLTKVHQEILNRIERMYDTDAASMRALSQLIHQQIVMYHEQSITPKVDELVDDITTKETVWATNLFEIYGTGKVTNINPVAAAKKAQKLTYQGHTFKYWFKKLSENSTVDVTKTLNASYINGDSLSEASKKVAGLLNRETRDVKTLTRSFMRHASVEAREKIYAVNDDIVVGFYWLSTLDGRTTPKICGVRDGKLYDLDHNPVGHDIPWNSGPGRIHFNCRSDQVAKIKGQGDLNEVWDRRAVGAGSNYERGDNKTRTGRIRKATKQNREKGLLKIKDQPDGTLYEDFLRKEKLAYVQDILGVKYAGDFKAGKISLKEIALSGNAADINTL